MSEAAIELIEDGGAAASEAEFFRCPEFLAAEGTTHTLRLATESGEAAVPLIVRAIPGADARDAVSPYSYPGARTTGERLDPSRLDLAATGLVSAFIRERLGEPALAGARERSLVLLSDPELPRKSRMSDRQQIRKNEAAGYRVRATPGPEANAERIAGFHAVYTETMVAVSAGERYLFERRYFDRILASTLSWLFEIEGPDGDTAAATIVVESDGLVHYYLSGTADAHRRRAPSKNLIAAVIDWAQERGAAMNLGGGVVPGDGLEEFKRGFANRELPYCTHELICDRVAYESLVGELEAPPAGDFFPAYRADG